MRGDLVTVVVAVRNGRGSIGRCLKSLQACARPSGLELEVVVVDDGSTDGTHEVVQGFPEVVLLRQDPRGPSVARNLGIQRSRGEVVAFTDDDCEVDRSWLIELVNTLRTTGAGAAGGSQLIPEESRGLARHVGLFLKAVGFCGGYTKLGESVREVDHNPACNSAYRRAALCEVGGFAENLWPGEDVELDRRLARKGYLIIYNPRARVHHHRRGSLGSFWRMMWRYGCQSGGYLTRHLGFFRPISLAPLGALALAVGLGFLVRNSLLLGLLAMLLPVIGIGILFRRAGANLRSLPILFALGALGFVAWNAGYVRGLFIQAPPRPGLADRSPRASPASSPSAASPASNTV